MRSGRPLLGDLVPVRTAPHSSSKPPSRLSLGCAPLASATASFLYSWASLLMSCLSNRLRALYLTKRKVATKPTAPTTANAMYIAFSRAQDELSLSPASS